ncbi:MAG: sorbosone dehydrogenase family protein [Chitinophagaceae bacterium]
MRKYLLMIVACSAILACNNNNPATDKSTADSAAGAQAAASDSLSLPQPYATPSVRNNSKVIGWPAGQQPSAPQGFTVSLFADSVEAGRWMYVAPNGDVFVAQADREGKKGNSILLFRDSNKDGIPESRSVYLKGLKQPFGMLIINDQFYVGNTDAVMVYPYNAAATAQTAAGKKIVSLPEGRHWTRNIVTNSTKDKLYIAVGSGSNVAENGIDKEARRACILQVNLDGSGEKVYASGLRNPVGMDWAPGTNTLWTAVNERDELGDDLVPDYLTSVREGGFYGWPYSYFGQHTDPRIKKEDQRPDLVQQAIVPEVAVGSHTSSLGLAFYTGNSFPEAYRNGAFVSQHGSWNRSHFSGYKVLFVPFANGKPAGKPQDFLTGFIASDEKSEVYGRPVGVAIAADGSLLVTDDGAGRIWRISYKK